MNRGFSIYLDAARIAAAFLVVLSHLAYPRYSGDSLSALREWDYGRDAVIIFFVLSGLVISYVAERDGTWARFAFNRATRLYSVLVPTLLLTLVFDRLGQSIAPAAYDGWWYTEIPAWQFLASGLSFSNEWIFGHVRLGTNGPLWSLSYEAAYYLLFAVAFFLKGIARLLLIVLVACLVGPRVLLLMPAWLCGVYAWWLIKQGAAGMPKSTAVLLVLVGPIFYAASFTIGLPGFLTAVGENWAAMLGAGAGLWFSNSFIWNTLIAALFMLHLVGMALLMRSVRMERVGRVVRWLAGASFTLYVLHYPLLQFIHVLLPADMLWRPLVHLVLVLVICFAVAELTERRLNGLRGFIRKKSQPNTAVAAS